MTSPTCPALPDLATTSVLVAGDVMLDRYWHGETARISPEAPVPVVRVASFHDARPGGAANVAVNLRRLGAGAVLVGAVGEDPEGAELADRLAEAGVDARLRRVAGLRTVTKLRVLSRHQQLLRIDIEDGPGASPALDLVCEFRAALQGMRVVVLSDYGKGALAEVGGLIEHAVRAGCTVLVDPKGTDFARYRGASVVTPNLHEFEAVAGGCAGLAQLEERAERLRDRLGLRALLITRGEEGMSLVAAGRPPVHVPAHTLDVFDVTGAGDTVIATLAAVLGAGGDLESAVRIANAAAAVVVAKSGTASATVPEIERVLHHAAGRTAGVMARDALRRAVAAARAAGERVVMTNGCFDLLHAGHVDYLTRARALGEHLVVAVNDDASVRRLKGEGRPLVPLAERMEVLAALKPVDWVVAFGEDTPHELVCEVRPDVLVKGGDYRAEDVAGAEFVLASGGRVEILGYRDGCSTTRLVEAARRSSPGAPGTRAKIAR